MKVRRGIKGALPFVVFFGDEKPRFFHEKEMGFCIPKEITRGVPLDPQTHMYRLFRMRSEGTADRSAIEWYCHSGFFLLVTKRAHQPHMTAVRPTFRRKKTLYCAGRKKWGNARTFRLPPRGRSGRFGKVLWTFQPRTRLWLATTEGVVAH